MATVGIIEDSSLVVQMLTMVCEQEGHDVDSYERFQPAAEAFAAQRPDIIITDLNLPDVDEGATLDELRTIEGLEDTPIVIISGRPRQELEELADEAGAQGALSKDDGMPVVSSELPPMIDELT